jgi:hypothetical protein
MKTETLREWVKNIEPEGFYGAAVLLRFAADVLTVDVDGNARWVVLRAIDRAEGELRDAADCGDDMNVVEARMAAIRLRLGLTDIRDRLLAAGLGSGDQFQIEKYLEAAATTCVAIGIEAQDA